MGWQLCLHHFVCQDITVETVFKHITGSKEHYLLGQNTIFLAGCVVLINSILLNLLLFGSCLRMLTVIPVSDFCWNSNHQHIMCVPSLAHKIMQCAKSVVSKHSLQALCRVFTDLSLLARKLHPLDKWSKHHSLGHSCPNRLGEYWQEFYNQPSRMKHQFFHLLTFVFAYIMSFDVSYTPLQDHLKNLSFIPHLHSTIDSFSTSTKSVVCFFFSQLIFHPKHIIWLNSCYELHRLKCLTIVFNTYLKKRSMVH